jgi:hypothetical protein
MPVTLGATISKMSGVVTGSVVSTGVVRARVVGVESCRAKLDNGQPLEVGLNGVGSETCWGWVASSSVTSSSVAPSSAASFCQSSASMEFTSSTTIVGTIDIEVEATGPSKPTWGWVLDKALVESWFKPENAEFPNIDGMSETLGVETKPVKAGVATRGAVGAGAVEGCDMKLDDTRFKLSQRGNLLGSVTSSRQSSGSNSSISSTSLSSRGWFQFENSNIGIRGRTQPCKGRCSHWRCSKCRKKRRL